MNGQQDGRYPSLTPLAEAHRAADMLAAGTFGETNDDGHWNGCSIGCFAREIGHNEGDIHAAVADHFGTPRWWMHFQDAMFEGLPEPDRYDWHVLASRLIDAAHAQGNFDWDRLGYLVRMVAVEEARSHAASDQTDVLEAIDGVLTLLCRAERGGVVGRDDWLEAERRAERAATAASANAASAASADAAWAASANAASAEGAAWAASAASANAAWAAWTEGVARAARAARAASWRRMRDGVVAAFAQCGAPLGGEAS